MPKKINYEERENKIIFESFPSFHKQSSKCMISVPYTWAKKYPNKKFKIIVELIN